MESQSSAFGGRPPSRAPRPPTSGSLEATKVRPSTGMLPAASLTTRRPRVSSAQIGLVPPLLATSSVPGQRVAESAVGGDVNFEEVPTELQPALMGAVLQDLVAVVEKQRAHFTSAVVQYEVAYTEMLAATLHLPVPNQLRTATSCLLLDRLLDTLRPLHNAVNTPQPMRGGAGGAGTVPHAFAQGSHEESSSGPPPPPLIDRLKADVFASIFSASSPEQFTGPLPRGATGAALLFRHTPYFTAFDAVSTKYTRAMEEYNGRDKTSEKQQLLLERVINRWQAMLVDRLFSAWRNYVRRNRTHSDALVKVATRHAHKVYKMWGFYTWRVEAKRSATVALVRTIERLHEVRQKDHQHFADETARLLQTIEALREERTQLAEQARKAVDEAASSKQTAEQLQLRFEQQRATAQGWKEVAIGLVNAMTPADPMHPETLLYGTQVVSALSAPPTAASGPSGPSSTPTTRSGSDIVGPKLAAWDPTAVAEAPAEKLLLQWATRSIADEEAATGLTAEPSHTAIGRLDDFDEAFRSGRALALLASRVGALPRGELYALLTRSSTAILSEVLPRLKDFVGCNVPLTPIEVGTGHPRMVYLLVALVMEKHHLHIARPAAVDRCVYSATYTKADETITLGDVRSRAVAAARQQQHWRLLVDSCRRHAVQITAKATTVVDQHVVDSVIDRQLLATVLSERNGINIEDRAGAALLTEVADQVGLQAQPLREIFGMYTTAKTGMTHAKFIKFLTDTKLLNKAFPKKAAANLFDYLLRAGGAGTAPDSREMSATDAIGTPAGGAQRGSVFLRRDTDAMLLDESAMGDSSRNRTSLTLPQWVCAAVHLAFLRDDRNALTPAKKLSSIVTHIQTLSKASGLDEFRDACYSRPVQDIFAKNNLLLSRIFETAAGSDDDPEMSIDEFLTVVKDAKLLDHNLSIDVCKKLFEFTQDAPLSQASMTYRDFLEALVALSIFKIPAPWIPLAERVKAFLRDTFLPPLVKKFKESKKK